MNNYRYLQSIYPGTQRAISYVQLHTDFAMWVSVEFYGFQSSVSCLMGKGWRFQVYHNPYTNEIVIKMHNPYLSLVATKKISLEEYNDLLTDQGCLIIDNLHAGGTRIPRKQPPLDKIVTMTEDDVPMLLETANKLLESNRKKHISQIELPEADIIYLNKLTKYFHTYGNID